MKSLGLVFGVGGQVLLLRKGFFTYLRRNVKWFGCFLGCLKLVFFCFKLGQRNRRCWVVMGLELQNWSISLGARSCIVVDVNVADSKMSDDHFICAFKDWKFFTYYKRFLAWFFKSYCQRKPGFCSLSTKNGRGRGKGNQQNPFWSPKDHKDNFFLARYLYFFSNIKIINTLLDIHQNYSSSAYYSLSNNGEWGGRGEEF